MLSNLLRVINYLSTLQWEKHCCYLFTVLNESDKPFPTMKFVFWKASGLWKTVSTIVRNGKTWIRPPLVNFTNTLLAALLLRRFPLPRYYKPKLKVALVYFSGLWENNLALWQYFKILLFQITNKTNLTWPYLTNSSSPSRRGRPKATFCSLFFRIFEFRCDARWLI